MNHVILRIFYCIINCPILRVTLTPPYDPPVKKNAKIRRQNENKTCSGLSFSNKTTQVFLLQKHTPKCTTKRFETSTLLPFLAKLSSLTIHFYLYLRSVCITALNNWHWKMLHEVWQRAKFTRKHKIKQWPQLFEIVLHWTSRKNNSVARSKLNKKSITAKLEKNNQRINFKCLQPVSFSHQNVLFP